MTIGSFKSLRLDAYQGACAFLNLEADLLDRHAYHEWLALWEEDARYIAPIDREATDYENRLNHIHDDASMRQQRVERFLSGYAPSASPIMRTVRSVSRVRILEATDDQLRVASSLMIVTFKRQVQKLIVADVTHRLMLRPDEVRIGEKIVLLINSDEPLSEMSFLL